MGISRLPQSQAERNLHRRLGLRTLSWFPIAEEAPALRSATGATGDRGAAGDP